MGMGMGAGIGFKHGDLHWRHPQEVSKPKSALSDAAWLKATVADRMQVLRGYFF